jgi:hypothetical protein
MRYRGGRVPSKVRTDTEMLAVAEEIERLLYVLWDLADCISNGSHPEREAIRDDLERNGLCVPFGAVSVVKDHL